MYKFAKKRPESRLTFGTRSSDVSKGSIPLYHAVDVILAVARMLYFAKAKWPDWRKSIRTLINLFIAVVCRSMIQQFVEMGTVIKEIPLKWRFRHFFKITPESDMSILCKRIISHDWPSEVILANGMATSLPNLELISQIVKELCKFKWRAALAVDVSIQIRNKGLLIWTHRPGID